MGSYFKRSLTFSLFFLLFSATEIHSVAWNPPVNVSVPGEVTFNAPHIAMNNSGQAVAVWQQKNTTSDSIRIQAATLTYGETWSPPVTLSADGQDAFDPRVAINNAGQAVAAWDRQDGTNLVIQAATWTASTGWSAVAPLSPTGLPLGDDADLPAVVINDLGQAIVVWQKLTGTKSNIQSATWTSGGGWVPLVDITASGGEDSDSPDVAINNSSQVIVVWNAEISSKDQVRAATSTFGGPWTTAASPLSASGQNNFSPAIDMNNSGQATVIWRRTPGADSPPGIIQASTSTFPGAWSTPVNISDDGSQEAKVVLNDAGQTIAAWSRSNGTNFIVQTSLSTFGRGWSTPDSLSLPGQNSSIPSPAINSSGVGLIAWEKGDQILINDLQAYSMTQFGKGWSEPALLSTAGQLAIEPTATLNDSSQALVSFNHLLFPLPQVQTVSGILIIQPTRNPRGKQKSNRFLTQTEYYNQIEGDGSTSHNISFYRINRGSTLLGTVSETSQHKFTERGQKKGRPVTYTITAVSTTGDESTPINVIAP